MNAQDQSLAEAAARLAVQDFEWLQGRGMIPGLEDCVTVTHAETVAQEPSSHEKPASRPEKRRRRRSPKHTWPDAGTILEADYHGEHYEAEAIEARRYKSGRALKLLTGPTAGRIFSSMSGAMLAATQAQRSRDGLGRKGIANGWEFWKVAGKERIT